MTCSSRPTAGLVREAAERSGGVDDLDDVVPGDYTVHTAIQLGDRDPWLSRCPIRILSAELIEEGHAIRWPGRRPCTKASAAPLRKRKKRADGRLSRRRLDGRSVIGIVSDGVDVGPELGWYLDRRAGRPVGGDGDDLWKVTATVVGMPITGLQGVGASRRYGLDPARPAPVKHSVSSTVVIRRGAGTTSPAVNSRLAIATYFDHSFDTNSWVS